MQRGSAEAMRGITPRLGGVGWAASFAGFISCVTYTILLGVSFAYLIASDKEPWSDKNYKRVQGCNSADRSEVGNAELYLYMNVTKVLDPESCNRFTYGTNDPVFNASLFAWTTLTWIIVFFSILGGPKTIGPIVLLSQLHSHSYSSL